MEFDSATLNHIVLHAKVISFIEVFLTKIVEFFNSIHSALVKMNNLSMLTHEWSVDNTN